MANSETFLQEIQESLSEIVKPFQRNLDQQQKLADFVNLCMRSAARDDFIQIDELLKTKMAEAVETDETLKDCKEILDRLRAYANEKVERYRIHFIEDLMARAGEVGLPLQVDFPRFNSLKGIEGTVDFGRRTTAINRKTLKSIDPRRIVSALLKEKRELYDRPFDPQSFIDGLHQTYREISKKEDFPPGHTVPIQRFYFDYVMWSTGKSSGNLEFHPTQSKTRTGSWREPESGVF